MADEGETGTDTFNRPSVKYKLPQYIQNMFLACGYDTSDVIAEMDVSQSAEVNDIDRMLNYVNKTFPQDQRFSRDEWVSSTVDIPPGHRILISKFVQDVKSDLSSFKRKSVRDKGSTKSSTKVKDNSVSVAPTTKVAYNANCNVEDLADTTSKLRKQIVNWQQKQNNQRLMQLKEHKDYEIQIERSLNPNCMFKATVLCNMCAKKVYLGVTESGIVKLSNWVRHAKSCTQEKKPKIEKQHMLTKYFSSSDSASAGISDASDSDTMLAVPLVKSSPGKSDILSTKPDITTSMKLDTTSPTRSEVPSSVKSDISPSAKSDISPSAKSDILSKDIPFLDKSDLPLSTKSSPSKSDIPSLTKSTTELSDSDQGFWVAPPIARK